MTEYFRIVQTVASLRISSGGPARTVSTLSAALGRLSGPVELVTLLPDSHSMEATVEPSPEWVNLTSVKTDNRRLLQGIAASEFRVALRQRCALGGKVVLHDNGIWLPTNHAVAAVSRELDIPLVISTRGMLEPWALNHRAWKKRVAWRLYQHRDLQTAAVLHATSEQEVESLRRLGLRQSIAVIPNGVELPEIGEVSEASDSNLNTAGSPANIRTALFLGRIHPIKGLIQLIDAWNNVRPPGWRLVIAGPDEGGHQAAVEARVREAGLTQFVEFIGPVEGAAKAALYNSADLFILPTFSENFGVVVAEALAYGVPVITTRGAPWEGLVEHRCGWWVDPTVDGIADALRKVISLDHSDLRAMGERGRVYARQFDWDEIAKDMLSVYRWVLGQGERPDCVFVD